MFPQLAIKVSRWIVKEEFRTQPKYNLFINENELRI
jgi:hypothetical protein